MIAVLQAKAAGLWTRSHIRNNVVAGIIVGVVALPLAMAFAIASGARPEQGLYTSIVAGILTSLFGGTRVQISGPTGAFIAVLSIITSMWSSNWQPPEAPMETNYRSRTAAWSSQHRGTVFLRRR